MRKFNPDKELYKLKYGKRDKVIFTMIFGIILLTIGYSFALYQVRHSKRIIYTTVDDFRNNKDLILTVLVDGEEKDDFPKKGDNYVFDHIDCDNKDEDYTVASWNYNVWGLSVLTKGPNKCAVYFRKLDKYQDTSGANPPELYQGLIPVYYGDNGEVYVANPENKWYDYDAHEWANAVLVNTSSLTTKQKYFNEDNTINSEVYDEEIPMEEIMQMYVWIPRYKYELFNAKNESKPEQMINIEFERETETTGTVTCNVATNGKETCENDENGQWYTHPAFKFGDTDLTGLWVGKFEPSGNESQIKIIPNVVPILDKSANYMFNASRNIALTYFNNFNLNKNEIDTHVMKNMDWGAMAYLTNSKYGRCDIQGECKAVTKNSVEFKTGYANSSQPWNTTNGKLASTTENMYGIYDTNGGAWEFMMALIANNLGVFNLSTGGLTSIDEKYYDKYEYGTSDTDPQRGHLGDATRETLQKLNNPDAGAWYGGSSYFPNLSDMWVQRGSRGSSSNHSIFTYYRHVGSSGSASSFRIVLTAQDGDN